jgi:hypothetical protein
VLLRKDLRGFIRRSCSIEFTELNGVHVLDRFSGLDDVSVTGLLRDTLGKDLLTLLLGLTLKLVILVDTLDESLAGLGLANVLNTDMETLGDDAGVNTLVDNNTNGTSVDIEDATGLTVVVLVEHAAVNGTISNQVDNVALLVDRHDLVEAELAVGLVGPGE